jgi:hypothetical protein
MSFVLGTPPSFRPGCSESERAADEAADYAPVILEIQAAGITSLTERGIPNPRGQGRAPIRFVTCSDLAFFGFLL